MGSLRRVLPWLAVLCALVFTVSCLPPFFPELAASASLVRHMSGAGTVGPYQLQTSISSATKRFLPSRPAAASIGDVSITSGFLVASSPTQDRVIFVYLDAQGTVQEGSFQYTLSVSGADPNFPYYQYDVIASSPTLPSIVVLHFDPTGNAALSNYQEMQGDPMTGQFTQAAIFTPRPVSGNIFAAGVTPVGASRDSTAAPDTFTFIAQNAGAMFTGSAPVDNTVGVFPTPPLALGPSAPVSFSPRAQVFLGKSGVIVGQTHLGGSWDTQMWPPGIAMTGVTRRLDAVLSSGDMLSTEGGNLTLYDSGGVGTKVLEVPLHGLQFCYEAIVGSIPYVFFSLPIAAKHDNVIFSIFAIPTSEMRSLGS